LDIEVDIGAPGEAFGNHFRDSIQTVGLPGRHREIVPRAARHTGDLLADIDREHFPSHTGQGAPVAHPGRVRMARRLEVVTREFVRRASFPDRHRVVPWIDRGVESRESRAGCGAGGRLAGERAGSLGTYDPVNSQALAPLECHHRPLSLETEDAIRDAGVET